MRMRYTDDDAEPGTARGDDQERSGTIFVALYGRLTTNRSSEDRVEEYDAYNQFFTRSLAMGWLDERSTMGDTATGMGAAGLWSINDAGWEHPGADPGARLVSWFQVTVSPLAANRSLPVQPLLRCADDTTARRGTLDLSTVQLLLPLQQLDRTNGSSIPVPATQSAHWHATSSTSRVPVRVSLNTGQDPYLLTVAEELIQQLDQLAVGVFVTQTHRPAGPGDVLAPPFGDWFWDGPVEHGLTIDGTITTWTCETVGWLAEMVSDLAARLGTRSPLLLTATTRT